MKALSRSSRCLYHLGKTRGVHMSALYRPVNVVPHAPAKGKKVTVKADSEMVSKSLKLLVDTGLMKQSSCIGAYHLLPVALKALEKLIKLVDKHLQQVNCHKIQMPTLTAASLWKTTGRLEECRPELMRVVDRHSKEYLLSPTHEEAICDLIGNSPLSYRQLPLRLYQTTEKFRDEMKPRMGLMRGRQFLMKDLYTFDASLEAAEVTYEEINRVYQKILTALDLNWIQAHGSTGTIGGLKSHEFHLPSEVGEDNLYHCSSCNYVFNEDIVHESEEQLQAYGTGTVSVTSSSSVSEAIPKCINCGSISLSGSRAIEVAHSFLLGTKYTKPLQVKFIGEENEKLPLQMGCYGLGVSRLLAAAVEVKSSQEEIRWPLRIAPYLVSVIPPKQGSKEEPSGGPLAQKMYEDLEKILPNEIIFDDRTTQTIGKRIQENKKLGIPYLVVFGKAIHDTNGPLIELHDLGAGTMKLEFFTNIVRQLYDLKTVINKME